MKHRLREPYKKFFGTLANQARMDIIETLLSGPMTVGQLALATNMEQSRVSHALQQLVKGKFVSVRRQGREKYCHLQMHTVIPLLRIFRKHTGGSSRSANQSVNGRQIRRRLT